MKNGEKSISRIRAKYQKPCFFAKYGNLDLYDEDLEKKIIIEHKLLEFNRTDEWNLIEIPEKEDENVSDQEYFCIHDDIFDRI